MTVSGIGRDRYSVVVQSGHGYVSLSSETVENQSLVGAWLELDNEVIHKISPNMLLSAPEGDYTLQILGNGANYQSQVSINRNQETVIDTSDVTITRPKEGLVTFEIDPDTADVFVDGTRMLTGVPQTIQYGYHNLKIIADGYITQTKYLKVGTPKSVISITLEKDESAQEASTVATSAASLPHKESTDASSKASTKEKKSDNSSKFASSISSGSISSNSSGKSSTGVTNKVIEGYRIYIDKPNGAELYFDGNYIGLIPCSVAKISGNHEIIVKKEGYETRSYRINIDMQETNLKYEFPDMVKIKDDDSASDKSSDSASEASTAAPAEASSEASSAPTEASSEASSAPSEASSDTSEDTGGSGASDSSSTDDDGSESSSEVSDAASTASASLGD